MKRVDNGSNTYSVATFKKLHDFSGEELAQIKQYADSFREQIKMMLHQRAADTETRSEASEMYETDVRYSTTENDGHFSISGSNVIDGERTLCRHKEHIGAGMPYQTVMGRRYRQLFWRYLFLFWEEQRMTMKTMTDEQRKFAEENHNLVYAF